jgi:hypothetical protein
MSGQRRIHRSCRPEAVLDCAANLFCFALCFNCHIFLNDTVVDCGIIERSCILIQVLISLAILVGGGSNLFFFYQANMGR